MFAKAVMPVLPGGKAKKQRNGNLLASAAARWAEGERTTLWHESLQRAGARPPRRRPGVSDAAQAAEKKREAVIALAERGLPGKAVPGIQQWFGS